MSKSALFVWGGWDGHEPLRATEKMAAVLKADGFAVDIRDTLAAFDDPAKLKTYQVIIPCWTFGTLTGDQERHLCDAVASGVGIAGWHGGIVDAFRTNTTYQFMTGGQFVAHPGNIIRYRVNIVDPEHPITRGLTDFDVHSEQYYMHVDPALKALATTRFSGGHEDKPWIAGVTMPTVWTKPWGRGRVFVSAIGHVAADLDGDEVREITRRGIHWAARALG